MSQAPARTLCAAPFRRLAPRLAPVLDRMAAGDPLRPRQVLVISGALRDHLQHFLANETPLAGVTFRTLEELARETAEPSLLQSRLRHIPPLGGPALMETILRDLRLGPLCPPEGVPGYGLALYETWKDIAESRLAPADLQARAPKFPRADAFRLVDLARISQEFEDRLGHLGYFDQPHLITKASEILEENPDDVPTVLYGFSDMNALQQRLALAVCRGSEAAAFVPADRDAPACAFARPFLRWLEAEGFAPDDGSSSTAEGPLEKLGRRLFGTGSPVPPPEGALQVVSAPAASREAFELCREILCEREKPAAPESAGLLLPSRKDYDPLFREIFGGMDLPVKIPDAGDQAACAAGRSFLRMLALKAGGYPRPEVMRFLDEGRLPATASFQERLKAEGIDPGAAAPSAWEYRSRDLPYLSGEEGWRNEIARALAARPEDHRLQSLSLATGILFEALGELPETATPSGHAKNSLEALRALTADLAGAEEIEETIQSLAELDQILGVIPAEEFQRWSRLALENAAIRPERVPARVHLMTLQQARGLAFETVAIPGLAEGVFPSRGAQDPILPDVLRDRLNREFADGPAEGPERLPLKAGRSAEERFLFWTAIQAAERRVVLGYPTGGSGPGEERDCPPSLFLEYLWEAAGTRPERAAGAALERGVLKLRPMTLLEHELSGMIEQLHGKQRKFALGHLTRRHPGFFRRIHAWRDRWQKDELTPFDGAFSDPDLIEWIRENRDPEETPVAVTSLETFFSCPYRYALTHLLHLSGKDEPERALEAAPDLRGNLYHETIKRFAEHVRKSGKGFGELTPAGRRDLITQSARAAFRSFEGKNQPPPPVTWRILRETVERDLNFFFEGTYDNAPGWKPVEMEGRFGEEGDPQSAPAAGGGSVRIRGRFDLVEQDENHFRFIDYKSGTSNSVKKTPGLNGGAALQPDLYAHHGRERFGEDARVGAAYAFISERGGYRLAEIPPETIADRRDDVTALLGFYVHALDKCCFFPAPSDACQHCDFVTVCGPDRGPRANRKTGHASWAALNELREKTK